MSPGLMHGEKPTRLYRVIRCDDLLAQVQSGNAAGIRFEAADHLADVDVSVPTILYGQTTKPSTQIREWPPGGWSDAFYQIQNGRCYTAFDADIHGSLGIITVGDFVLEESLYLTLPDYHGFKREAPDGLHLPVHRVSVHVPRALHALCGYVGNRDYAHWWIDIVPLIGEFVSSPAFANATLMLPRLRAEYQHETLDLLPEVAGRTMMVDEDTTVRCRELKFIPRLTASDFVPHPSRMSFIRRLKEHALGGNHADRKQPRKLFISRRDTGARVLNNEANAIVLAAQFGFEPVVLKGMALADQMLLFSQASHVIGAHGAGLTNILFCQPWTRVLELLTANDVNWAYRRLASIIPMTYGCLISHHDPSDALHASSAVRSDSWHVSIDQLYHVLNDDAFTG